MIKYPTMSKAYPLQQGVATLVFSIIVLILVTFVTLYTSKSIIVETKISNNQKRSEFAFEAAEAGVAHAFAQFKDGRRYDYQGGIFGDTTDTTLPPPASYQTDYISIYESPGDTTSRVLSTAKVTVSSNYIITSVGTSDDNSAERTVVLQTTQALGINNKPDNPFIARGNTSVGGSATIFNPEGASTIWSGGAVDLSSARTYIADPSKTNYPQCMETSFSCESIAASLSGAGVDAITNDSTLAGLSNDEMFTNFMGMSPDLYRVSGAVTTDIDTNASISPDGVLYTLDSYVSDPAFQQIIWVDGDLKTTGMTLGCTVGVGPPSGLVSEPGKDQLFEQTMCEAAGGEVKPVTLIVNGDWSGSGNFHLFGLMIVLGDVHLTGTPVITGALIVTGEATDTGNLNVWYNSEVINKTNDVPEINATAGGWRDF